MPSKYNFFKKTNTFIKDIARSEIIIQAVLVGLISGLLVVLFELSINKVSDFVQSSTGVFPFSKRLLIFPLITTLGGLISGILVFKVAPETRGSGIPYVKLTLARIGKGTRLRTILVKFFAGVAGIGTGLSLGREGPSVQLGSGTGALVSKLFKVKGTDQDKLIAAGAGSALGATFNAPIAATIFVLEELVQSFSSSLLFPVLIATVSASAIARSVMGSNPSFDVPKIFIPITPESIPIFIILGIIAGILGVLFAKNIFFNIRLFDKMEKIPQWARPAIAGFAIGLIGLFIPYILGTGSSGIDLLLEHNFTVKMLLVIFVAKFIVTPFCFGSGAAGGIFLPMLMLGSFLGYFIGLVSNSIGIGVDPIVISLVGMGAFLSAVARTPITAVVMVFEMTGDYNHILPIMLSAAVADLIAEKLNHAPIYSTLIYKQGSKTKEAAYLRNSKIKDFMTEDILQFNHNMKIKEALLVMKETGHAAFPVVTDNMKLTGIITKADIENAFLQGNSEDTPAEKIMNPRPQTAKPENDLYMASFKLHSNNTEWLIITDRKKQVKGILTRVDINKALAKNTENK